MVWGKICLKKLISTSHSIFCKIWVNSKQVLANHKCACIKMTDTRCFGKDHGTGKKNVFD